MTTSTADQMEEHKASGPPMKLSESLTAFAKTDSQDDTWSSNGVAGYINPFVHELKIDNRLYWAKVYLFTAIFLPVRALGMIVSLVTAWMFACIGMIGISEDALRNQPMCGWRRGMQHLTSAAMRMVFAFGSFHWLTVKGKPATSKEAPIVVIAPHSSYVDSIVVVAFGPPSLVAKQDTAQLPFLGKIIEFSQPIFVHREDPNSRQNTIREITHRAHSDGAWPHIVIYPEGTCTNRNALIKFKAGAFIPGKPVQPVLLRYPNKYDTCTWTWSGPGIFYLLWLTMMNFCSFCEIEYLPVYHPTQEEQNDANLYAKNVRDYMARALQVPTSEYSYEDVFMMSRARDMGVPFPGDIVEIDKTLHYLGLRDSKLDTELATKISTMPNVKSIDFVTFAELLQEKLTSLHLRQLFVLLDHHSVGSINLKSFILCSIFCKRINDKLIDYLRAVTPVYAESSEQISREQFLKIVLRHAGELKKTEAKWNEVFFNIDEKQKGHITFDDFEAYTQQRHEFSFLFKPREVIRRYYDK